MTASTPTDGDGTILQQCDCCGQEAERLFNHTSTNGLWICRDCLHMGWHHPGVAPIVTITDDESGTEWQIY